MRASGGSAVSTPAGTALERDPHAAWHWLPRAAGTPLPGGGSLFAGRRAALENLSTWLGERASPRRLRVVTGPPGSGTSAVLARLVVSADPGAGDRLSDLPAPGDPTLPPAGAFDVVFHASDRTAGDLVAGIAAAAEVDAGDPFTLAEVLRERGHELMIAVDAIEEARDPDWVCRLLRNLTVETRCRVLAGCDPRLLDQLGDPAALWLDRAPYDPGPDVIDLVTGMLARGDADANARQVADAADGNFLTAGLSARSALLRGRALLPLPRTLDHALDDLLDALAPGQEQVRGALLPLAYAAGDGLPAGALWRTAVTALHGSGLVPALDELSDGPAAPLLTVHATDGHEPTYRLAHRALDRSVRRGRDHRADRRRLFAAWRAEHVPAAGGVRRWEQAPGYLRRHGADHAAGAGALEVLGADLTYLSVGPLRRLDELIEAHGGLTDLADLLRLVAARAEPLSAERRATALTLAARRGGHDALADRLTAVLRPAWETVWVRVRAPQPVRTETVVPKVVYELNGYPRVWDTASDTPVGPQLWGHAGGVIAVAVGEVDGAARIVSGGADGSIRVWDTDAAVSDPLGAPLTGHSGPVCAVAIGAIGGAPRVVSGGYDGTVRLWDPTSGTPVGTPLTGHHGVVSALAIGAVGGALRIVSGGSDGTVRLWDPTNGTPVGTPLTGHAGAVSALAVGRIGDAVRIASGGGDETVRLWDAGGTCTGIIDCVGKVTALAVLPEGDLGVLHDHGVLACLRERR